MGVDCGHAFQLTNILRDVVEDARRSRLYLADEDLVRTGFERESLIRSLLTPDPKLRRELIDSQGDWRALMRLYTQRTAACYQNGWGIFDAIDWDSRRMFSMIWNTYHQIFKLIEKDPWAPVLGRPTLSSSHKLKLYASHAFTPWFQSLDQPAPKPLIEPMIAPPQTPRVAIIGGGLAGIQTAMHLAKHGCQTWLFEARSRLGGRVGSFADPKSEQSIDYCQHVGMRCCSELVRWIEDMEQSDQWHEEPTLWFRSRTGRPFRAAAWPLPAPLHLAGLLLKWPDLSLLDRTRIAWGLLKLIRTVPDRDFQDELALGWLERNHQTKNAIDSFWSTILVSALGEQMPRITMGSVHKVIIDGFAATRDAYHLLVPRKSLSELVDRSSRKCLQQHGVQVVDGAMISGISPGESRGWRIRFRNPNDRHADGPEFHSVVVAVPWHRISDILEPDLSNNLPELAARLSDVEQLESAPITGIHTWWSKPWFKDPHAILIDRLCQWIFPGPQTTNDRSSDQEKEHYYQIIISGSRDLPKGDPDGILQMVQADLREVFPEITKSGAVLLRGKVITDPQSVFSVHTGHAQARLDANLFGDQGLFLAGDWTATGWPATMEGALRSGSIAASGVLSYVGRPADVSVDGR
jgi:squalene-associated FAD-dependent desaturase